MINIADYRVINDFSIGNIFFHRFRRYGHAVTMDQAEIIQFFHHSFYTTGIMEISRIASISCWSDFDKMRNLFCQFIECINIKINACRMGQCSQMKYRIGRAADCHIESNGIFNSFFRNNLTRQDILFKKFHDFHARPFSQCQTLASCGQIIRTRQAHAQGFGHIIHRIACTKQITCAASRKGYLFTAGQFFPGDDTADDIALISHQICIIDFFAINASGCHRTTADQNSRYVQPYCSQEHPRSNFITVRNHDHCIVLMSVHHAFNRISNEFTAGQWVMHTKMTLGNTVTNSNGRKFYRRTSCSNNTFLDSFGNRIQMNMSRHGFVLGIYNCYDRFFQVFRKEAHGIIQSTMGSPFNAFCRNFASHFFTSLL